MLLYGTDFPDQRYVKDAKDGTPLYSSYELSNLWPYGLNALGDVTFESAAYVARYVLKKVSGPLAEWHYSGREPEFVNMSRRPGIGAPWIARFGSEVYSHDSVIIRGIEARPPRFYDNKYEIADPIKFELVKRERMRNSKGWVKDPEQRFERRIVREAVAHSKANLYRRDVNDH